MASLHNTNKTCTGMTSHNWWVAGLAASLQLWIFGHRFYLQNELLSGNMNRYFLHFFFLKFTRESAVLRLGLTGDQKWKSFPTMHCSIQHEAVQVSFNHFTGSEMKTKAVNKLVKSTILFLSVWTFKPTAEDMLIFDLCIDPCLHLVKHHWRQSSAALIPPLS